MMTMKKKKKKKLSNLARQAHRHSLRDKATRHCQNRHPMYVLLPPPSLNLDSRVSTMQAFEARDAFFRASTISISWNFFKIEVFEKN
jgi:hypothetical protein